MTAAAKMLSPLRPFSFRGILPAVQIKGQLQLVPEVLHGYGYAAGSLAAGALLGVLVYGPMAWTA